MNPIYKTPVIALAGNPNSGKTTLFNNLTGAHQHVGNYPGVTVEIKEGTVRFHNREFRVVDLPGVYSLSAHSPEELLARNFIIDRRPDVVVNIVDASNLERNLYLTTQLLELGRPMVLALNMSDMAQREGIIIDHDLLGRLLGVPVIATVGPKHQGMSELLEAAARMIDDSTLFRPAQVNYGLEFENEINRLAGTILHRQSVLNGFPPRWTVLRLLENDRQMADLLQSSPESEELMRNIAAGQKRLQSLYGTEMATIISDRRYGFISGAGFEVTSLTGTHRHDMSDKIDLVLIHPVLGLIIFAVLMWLMFNLTFILGEIPVKGIEAAVAGLSGLVSALLPDGPLRSLLTDGVIAGVGGVITFLPNIMLLFLAIAVLEDTGYMARAAFVMDRIMHKIGLHGKSFIPMLIGFGCSVPAYMGSRILEDRTDRLITMQVTTFMSCGARLPIYILVAGAFWPQHAGNVVFSIYLLGIVIAIGTVKLLRLTRFRSMSAPFIMELPPYRIPTLRSLLIHIGERSWLYLKKAGTIILGISIIMWFLMTFPEKPPSAVEVVGISARGPAIVENERTDIFRPDEKASQNDLQITSEKLEYSLAGRLGKIIEPAIAPLGFDWRLGIATISCLAAKEMVVSTMATIYGVGEAGEESASLRQKLAADPAYSKLTAYTFLVFILLFMPCLAALAVFYRETASAKELFFQIGYTMSLAYGMAFIIYQGGSLLGLN